MSKILSVATVNPAHRYTTDEIISAADSHWLGKMPEKTRSLALKILRGAEIETRQSVAPLEIVFSDLGFAARNDLYIEAMKELAERALLKACAAADISPSSLDYLITTSCTGFMIPSVDAYLVEKLGLKRGIVRLPVTEMGCAGGTSGLIYADRILRADPRARAAVIACEAPSLTFQKNDLSAENLVSTAIFADGAACAVLGHSDKLLPEIVDSSMHQFPNSTHLMGYRLTDTGLKIVLDREVPSAIEREFPRFFQPLLDKNGLTTGDISHFVFHPGGKKIIRSVEKILAEFGKNVESSKEILREHGNLSSATVLFVLDRILQRDQPRANDYGYMLAFGPGFSAQSILLRWTGAA